MFGRVVFRNEEKKMRENEEEKLFGGCLIGKERWKNDGVFFLSPLKTFLPKMKRKLGGEKSNG